MSSSKKEKLNGELYVSLFTLVREKIEAQERRNTQRLTKNGITVSVYLGKVVIEGEKKREGQRREGKGKSERERRGRREE